MFLPPKTKEVLLCKKPISMQWGHNRLNRLCIEELGIDPSNGDVFMFFNKAQDCLRVFFVDDTGDQSLTKKLDRGGFLVPTNNSADLFVRIRADLLPTLFKSG